MARLAAEGIGGGEGVARGFLPDRTLAEGDAIEGPGWRLDALHTPGHFAGHLCFAWDDLLFTGDHVMGWAPSLVSPPDGDMGAYMASLARLAGQGWRRFLPGHGAPVETPEARIAELLAHRRGREAKVLAALDHPLQLPDIVARVYADTPPALHLAAARNALAHLIDLWQRGRITAAPTPGPAAAWART
jgi:hydroxyacylglutathione hydrolase